MMFLKYLKRTAPFFLALFLTSCLSQPAYFNQVVLDRDSIRIAVLPFRDYKKNEGNNSGDLVRNVFETKLINRGFKTIDVEKIASGLEISNLQDADINSDWIIETGRAINADYMVFGSIYDYRVFEYSTTFIYIFEWLETTYSLGVTARMVSCKTGNVVWSGTHSSKSYTFNDAAEDVVNAMIKTMKYKSSLKK